MTLIKHESVEAVKESVDMIDLVSGRTQSKLDEEKTTVQANKESVTTQEADLTTKEQNQTKADTKIGEQSLQPVAEKVRAPYLRSETNLGFAGGANLAIDWVIGAEHPRAVCIVNNDVIVPDHSARPLSTELLTFFED